MLTSIILLLLTLVIVPLAAFWYSDPPTLLQTDMLSVMIIAVSVVIAYCFIVGELSKNNSQVDKLWSIIPIYYACHMTALGGFHPRMILMSALVCVWGIRLTYNFARRGAYQWKFWQGEEDYRWEILRQKPGFNRKPVWMAFNLFFISTYQNILIFLFTLPILTALSSGAPKQITQADIVLSLLFLAAVVVEFIADQQQYDFQTEKHRRLMAGEPLQQYAAGFVSTGLWSLVRHPNYAMEQLIWILFYCFSIVATGNWMNWSIPGCLLLIALFKGSSDFSESISAKKYPAYTEYKKKVPRFIPFIK